MAFTLQIRFTGLFMFVPDFENRRLVVLLPKTDLDPVERHYAKISNEKAASVDWGIEDLTVDVKADQEGLILPPQEAVDLEEITKSRLPRSQIDPTGLPNEFVHARMFLPAATSMKAEFSALWRVPSNLKRKMSNRIIWTLENVEAAELRILRTKYDSSSAPALEYKPSGSTLKLCVNHIPDPTHVHVGPEAKHFQAYYRMFVPRKIGNNPFLAEKPGSEPPNPCIPQAGAGGSLAPPSASTFTCMISQVRAG